jgi:hypothetical protein
MAGVKRGEEKKMPEDIIYWYENLPRYSVFYLAHDTYNLSREQVEKILVDLGLE